MANRDSKEDRPNPDHLLTITQRESNRQGKGKLKVFLGMVAGVGKTYAMLQRAHQLKSQGEDVVVGWIDTHGRKETEALVRGLEVLPRQSISYRGIEIPEMDLDLILKRRPKTVIVDELAHTNAPGARHQKRYLDVLELLNAGIDVFTAMNIQHLESRVDTVREITGVSIQETVPDSILDEADEIALIDLPPEDVLKRLKEGRIYASERAEAASRNFFTMGNLTALRELALRTATERVDKDLRNFKTLHGIEAAWKSSSRLMVAVFGSPYSESLIRATRKISDSLHASWIGVHIDTGLSQSAEETKLLQKNTELVRQLGGDFHSFQDSNLVDGLLRVARQQNVTLLVVGKTQRGRLKNILQGGSTVSRLLRKSGDIDIYALSPNATESSLHQKLPSSQSAPLYPWGEMGWAAFGILVAWASAGALNKFIGYESVGTLFLLAVTLSGIVLSRATVFTIAIALSLIHNFFFIPPLLTFSIGKPQDLLMFLMYFIAASAIGHLTTKLKKQNRLIQAREDKALELFKLAHGIADAKNLDRVVGLGLETLNQTFGAESAFVLVSESLHVNIHGLSSYQFDEKELAVAKWVKQNGKVAGRFTDTLPSARATYFPVNTKAKTIGAIGIKLPAQSWDYERRDFAYALVGQISAGVEREQLHESRKRVEILEQTEKLYRSLFDSVSHELKTPLTIIQGAASALTESGATHLNPTYIQELSSQVSEESERLLEVVNNMLDMTRVESGTLKPSLQIVDVADLIGPAMKYLHFPKGIEVSVEPNTPSIYCDPTLTVQALVNILKNALMYGHTGGANASIQVQVKKGASNQVEFHIRDDGPGLPKSEPDIVFRKFYRQNPKQTGGVGLGLSISQAFIEAQDGKLYAQNRDEGGAHFTVTLPSE